MNRSGSASPDRSGSGAASPLIAPPTGAGAPPPRGPAADRPHHPPYRRCFGCGPDHPTGLRIEVVRVDAGSMLAQMHTHGRQVGAPGAVHGGVLAAALDEVAGMLVWSLGGRYATARLETDFLLPVPAGTTLMLRASCTGVLGRKVYVDAGAFLGGLDGALAARAAALYVERQDIPTAQPPRGGPGRPHA